MILDKFYPIFEKTEWLEKLLPVGIKLVQLRIKDQSIKETQNEIKKAKSLCSDFNAQLIVNDYWEIAIDEKCDFVHIGQEDLVNCDIKKLKFNNIKIGISTHDEKELETALLHSPDYIALGPIYPTIFKALVGREISVGVLKWKKKINNIPLVAIGGMTPSRSIMAFNAGADIVSAVTDITLNKHPETRVKEWMEVIRNNV